MKALLHVASTSDPEPIVGEIFTLLAAILRMYSNFPGDYGTILGLGGSRGPNFYRTNVEKRLCNRAGSQDRME